MTEDLELDRLERNRLHRLWVPLAANGLGQPECVPVMVLRGARDGLTVGLTAALHGNELNGIPVVHRLFERIDPTHLKGTIVAVPVVNVVGLHALRRRFVERFDLNHRFPGTPDGNVADVYVHRLMERIIKNFDAMLDLHTASFGRENTLYVRADMTEPRTATMAYLQRPQIIVHNPPADGTLRGAAAALGIPAITVEIGDANSFQERYIKRTLLGVRAVLMELGLIPRRPLAKGPPPLICRQSMWVYSDGGGLQTVIPQLGELVAEGEQLARRVNVFGDLLAEIRSPVSGVVVGRSTHPVVRTGSRVIHLGVLADTTDTHILDRGESGEVMAH